MEEHLSENKDNSVDVFSSRVHRTHPVHMGMPVSRHYLPSLPSLSTVNSSCCTSIASLSTGYSGFSKDTHMFSGEAFWTRSRNLPRPTPEIFYTHPEQHNNPRNGRQFQVTTHSEESYDDSSGARQMPILLDQRIN